MAIYENLMEVSKGTVGRIVTIDPFEFFQSPFSYWN